MAAIAGPGRLLRIAPGPLMRRQPVLSTAIDRRPAEPSIPPMPRAGIVASLTLACGLAAGESTPPPALDPTTQRRAEIAAEAYLRELAESEKKIDPDMRDRCAKAEQLVATAQLLLEKGETIKAGDSFVTATSLIKAIPNDQRHLLGKRYRAVQDKLTELSRQLLGGLPQTSAPPKPTVPAPTVTSPAPTDRPQE